MAEGDLHVFCETDHPTRPMNYVQIEDVFRCPKCRRVATPAAVEYALPPEMRTATSRTLIAGFLDAEVDVVFRNGGRAGVLYRRPSQAF